ncbi:MAG: tetratricopeptide repeat protein [Desulfamplus sp.]|nr:tetratricopeptide repeat protein [Desulfamplus sp.]
MRERITLQDLLNQKIVHLPEDNALIEPENSNLIEVVKTVAVDKSSFIDKKMVVDDIFKKGVKLLKSEKYCCAAAFFETILSLEPEHIKAQLNLGVALYQIGEYKKALNILEKVVEQEPDNEIANCNIRTIKKDFTNF